MATGYLVGLDVGSTTVKVIVQEEGAAAPLCKVYRRHGHDQMAKVWEVLRELEEELNLSRRSTRLFVTGSGGMELSGRLGARYVQEVHAVSLAVEGRIPGASCVVELGGQDAKMIFFDRHGRGVRRSFAMNDKCAGGTGAAIDRIARKLELDEAALAALPYRGVPKHPVAGRCGVFAETDITNLRNRGVPPEELMASLFAATVVQNLSSLARGRTPVPEVILLGGPHRFLPALVEAWREELLRLWEERGLDPGARPVHELVYAPEDAEFFPALGAIDFGRREASEDEGRYRGLEPLEEWLERRESLRRGAKKVLPGPAADREAFERFLAKYRLAREQRTALQRGELVRGFLGIDGGSTSVKAVAVSVEGEVKAKAYRLAGRNPLADLVAVLGEIQRRFQEREARLEILGVGTTGYSKDLFREVLSADVALVETVAHARAALQVDSEVEVVVDVGGQDIKLIVLREGHVQDFMLNSQCSAGNGFYLQATAEAFGVPVEQYAEAAFSAALMPEFRHGCAVFLQADIVDFQKQGWRPAEILAGLAEVLPKNVWLYVARIPHLPSLGTRFVLQGGTHRNLAAVKAQEDYIRKAFQGTGREPVIRVHPHCGEAGAIGAAWEAARLWRQGRRSTFIGLDRAVDLRFRVKCDEETRCNFCRNHCLRTLVEVDRPGDGDGDRIRFIVAGCEKGAQDSAEDLRRLQAAIRRTKTSTPNLAAEAAQLAWRSPRPRLVVTDRRPGLLNRVCSLVRRPRVPREAIRIGIPRALALYQYAPLFRGYLEALGVRPENIVVSEVTSESMFRSGVRHDVVRPCYPARAALAHVYHLLSVVHRKRPLHCIFFPLIATLPTDVVDATGQDACCTLTATPQTIRAALTRERDLFQEAGVVFLTPYLELADREVFAAEMWDAWEPWLKPTAFEHEAALEEAWAAQERFEEHLQRRAQEIIELLEREQRVGILVLGRPYHHDPGINHGIFERLQQMGYPVLTQHTLPADPEWLRWWFQEDLDAGRIPHPKAVGDVWPHAYSTNSNQKIWAAKLVARYPRLVALDFSNFNCGHDAAIARTCEAIIETSGIPLFRFRDLDENRPTGTFQIRLETIDYFLREYQVALQQRALEASSSADARKLAAGVSSGPGRHSRRDLSLALSASGARNVAPCLPPDLT